MYWVNCIDGYVDLDKAFSIKIESNGYKFFVVARFSSNPKDEGVTLMDFTDNKKAIEFLERLRKDMEENERRLTR